MHTTHRLRRHTRNALAAALVALPAACVWAQGVPVEDDELGDAWGQAMFTVTNTDAAGSNPFDFTRITLNADVKLNANFYNTKLGTQGIDSAIDIPELRFVDSASGNYVKLTDPYIEFVYKNQNSTTLSDREIIGMRFGFGGIDGNLGAKFNLLRGNIVLQQGTGATNAYGTLTLNTLASTATAGVNQFQCASGCTTLGVDQIGSLSASGTSDFFVSLLSSAATYTNPDGTTSAAQSGVSMNWTQGVSYVNATGVILPNPLPALRVRQGG